MSVVLQVYTIIKDLKGYKRSICRLMSNSDLKSFNLIPKELQHVTISKDICTRYRIAFQNFSRRTDGP